MKHTIYYNYTYVIILLILGSCNKVKDWNDPADKTPPGIVSNVKVENLNGGARIIYSLPTDNDLLGVKATYSFGENNKENRESFSSAFRDTIELAGYGDTLEHKVYLYTVDKSKNESSPVEVTIKPFVPPVVLIRSSFNAIPTFGGIYTTWNNPDNNAISVALYKKDNNGEFVLYDTYYTDASRGRFAFRGLDSSPQEFKFELRDRWGNYALPLDTILTPLFETEIMGKDEKGLIWQQWGYDDGTHLFRGDMHRLISGRTIANAVDGVLMSGSVYWHCSNNVLADFVPGTSESNLFPYYFTIDMVKKASYSRLRMWMRDRNPLFSAELPSVFEIWATNNPKPLNEIGDGSKEDNLKYWTEWPAVGGADAWKKDWVKIADCRMELPSGATSPGTLTNEDQEYVRNGFEYEIDPDQANNPYRYLRFVVYQTNTGVPQFMISELKFWGSYSN